MIGFAFKRVGNLESSKDIINDSFLKLICLNESGKIRECSNPNVYRAYLYKILVTECCDFIHAKQIPVSGGEPPEVASDEDKFNDMVKRQTISNAFNEIKNLPSECRKVCECIFIKELSRAETSEKLGISKNTVKNQRAKGLELIRKRIAF